MQNNQFSNGNPYRASIVDLSRFESKIRILPKNIDPKLFFGPEEHYVGSKFCVESISGTLRAIGDRWSTQKPEYHSEIQKSQLRFWTNLLQPWYPL